MKRDEKIEQDNLQTLKISEMVSYQYRTANDNNYSKDLLHQEGFTHASR